MNKNVRRLWIVACALALVVAVAGCATSSYSSAQQKPGGPLVGHEVADSNNDGAYVSAGALTYQLQVSRQLNQYGVEDSQYIKGLPPGYPPPTPHQLWYGVFLWAKNQTHQPHRTTDKFVVVDTQGNKYYPVKLNPALNPFAWTSETLQPLDTQPGEDTIAASFFTGGKLLLFKLNDSIYDNRPLTLYILSHTGKRIGEISLDL